MKVTSLLQPARPLWGNRRTTADMTTETLKNTEFAIALRRSTAYLLKRAQQVLEVTLDREQFGDPVVLGQLHFEMLVAVSALPQGDQGTLGNAIGIDKSSATAIIDALERLKLLRRREHEDRRRRHLLLSPRVAAVAAKGWMLRERASRRLLSVLTAAQAAELTEGLYAFANIAVSGAPEWVRPDADTERTPSLDRLHALYRTPGFLLRRCGQVGRGFGVQATMLADFTEGQAKMLYLICALGQVDMPMLLYAFATERPTIAVILRALEDRQLIEQARNPLDRRRKLIKPTPSGLRAMKSAKRLWDDVEESLVMRLTRARHERLVALLEGLTLDGIAPPPCLTECRGGRRRR